MAEQQTVPVMVQEVQGKLSGLISAIKEVQGTVKQLNKEYVRLEKEAKKGASKRGKKAAKTGADPANPRPPSGFAKPTKLSPKLCDFLDVPHGTEKSRTDVTRVINAYVKENKLQNPDNLKEIKPDIKLAALLNTADSDEVLTYFNLQRFMKPLFISSAAAK